MFGHDRGEPVAQRSSGCECRTVIVNHSALGSGTMNVTVTIRHHQRTRRTVRIRMSRSIGGSSWGGGCSADGGDTLSISGISGGYVADAFICVGCSSATPSYLTHGYRTSQNMSDPWGARTPSSFWPYVYSMRHHHGVSGCTRERQNDADHRVCEL